MRINNPEKRLRQFWGKVDQKHIHSIAKWVTGKTVLDVGSGFGTTCGTISKHGVFQCTGIDTDETSVETAKRRYPNGTYLVQNCEKLTFEDNSFDTIILRDVLHHLKGESDFGKSKNELMRVAKPNGKIIIFDPNINFVLKTARFVSSHKDEECTFEEAIKILDDLNCKIIHKEFNTFLSLALSGGYVGISFVPNIDILQNAILKLETFSEKIINSLKLGSILCWRYMLVAQVNK